MDSLHTAQPKSMNCHWPSHTLTFMKLEIHGFKMFYLLGNDLSPWICKHIEWNILRCYSQNWWLQVHGFFP